MVDVFLSSAPADRARIEHLAHALEGRGFDVVWDHELFVPAEAARREAALRSEAKAVLIAWSDAAKADPQVLADARARGDSLIAVTLDGAAGPIGPTPEDLTHWPHGDAAEAFERVIAAIEIRRGAPSPVEPASPEHVGARRAGRRLLVIAAVAVIGVLAGYAGYEVLKTRATAPAPTAETHAANETTDSPGAAELYGFTPEEIPQYTPRELIAAALQNTTIDAIEQDARGGDRFGQTLLCLSRAYGEGLPKNLFIARQTCETAAAAGDALARYQLSLFMRDGDAGFVESVAAANRARAEAVEAGDPRAQTDAALDAEHAGRASEAQRLLNAAAEKNYRPALLELGASYEQGAEADPRRALSWYQRAAELGYAPAARLVGQHYEQGEGVLQDYAQARRYYQQGSDAGDAEASLALARMTEAGQGGEPDPSAARALYQKALQQGAEAARPELARLNSGG